MSNGVVQSDIHPDILKSNPDFRSSGFPQIRILGSPGISECPDCISGSPDIQIFGFSSLTLFSGFAHAADPYVIWSRFLIDDNCSSGRWRKAWIPRISVRVHWWNSRCFSLHVQSCWVQCGKKSRRSSRTELSPFFPACSVLSFTLRWKDQENQQNTWTELSPIFS